MRVAKSRARILYTNTQPDSIPMVPGGGVAIPLVELNDPLVQSTDLVQPVVVTRGRGAIVRIPGEFWAV